MNLLQMSFSGAVMIAVVVIIRALAINRLPKRTFLILWGVVLIRLLVPFSVPSALSVYSLIGQKADSDSLVRILSEQRVPAKRDVDTNARQYHSNPQNDNDVIYAGQYHPNPQNDNDEMYAGQYHPELKNDNGVMYEGQYPLNSQTDSGVMYAGQYHPELKTDSDVISGEGYDTNEKSDTSVGLSQTLQNSKPYVVVVQQIPAYYKRFVYDQQFQPLCLIIWCGGMIVCIGWFAGSYLRCRFEFRISVPVENVFVQSWMQQYADCGASFVLPVKNASVHKWLEGRLRRRISVRQSDRISTPLTYGIFHPVILMPQNTDWENTGQLQYILMHECVHVCRYDTLTKLIMVSALCIHWFNPAVWIMYVLYNRDVEISCDERVVRQIGETSKSAYAMMLIQMEAERSGLAPLCSGLLSKIGKNAMEERITAIMKIKKKSVPAGIAAAVLVISVTAAFATSAAEAGNKNSEKLEERTAGEDNHKTVATPDTNFTEQEYEMLLALKFDGYEDMSISEFQNKVWALTDTEEYNDIIERFFQDEAVYAKYETTKGTDSSETYDFLYNVLGPIMSDQKVIRFNGYAMTDFSSASHNSTLEYTGTLTILDADQLTVGDYISVRHDIMERMENILQDLTVSELRDEEFMQVLIDEEVRNITMTYQYDALHVAMEYSYRPLSGVAVDEMDDWEQERRDEWDRVMEPYVPFGLTYRYDWDTDDYKMFFNGKEVRGIYDRENHVWISEHAGIGKDIYDENATELFVLYEDHKIVGLREATAQEMEEITTMRQAATDAGEEYQENPQYVREYAPATREDYQSLFALRTSDYRQKSIAEFDMEFLGWCNENDEQKERIDCDRSWNDYRVVLTDEEKSFVELTTWLSLMENVEYVRSIQNNEPERDISDRVRLSGKEEYAQNGYGLAWCSLDYSFSYRISDREKVSIGERDSQVGKMVREIQDDWDSSDLDEILQMTKDDVLEWLHSIAARYSSQDITITILDDHTYFESKDERMQY